MYNAQKVTQLWNTFPKLLSMKLSLSFTLFFQIAVIVQNIYCLHDVGNMLSLAINIHVHAMSYIYIIYNMFQNC